MSPEQAGGGEADARSDEYALACVLYEMLGGTPPFTGPTPQAVMARHALDPVPDLGTVRSTVPEGVIAAVERAMAKVPADRYPSAGGFAEALEKGDEKRAVRDPKRRQWEYVVGALIVLMAAALYLVVGRTNPGAYAEDTRLAVLPFDIAAAEVPDTAFAEALYSAVIDELSDSGVQPISAIAMRHYRGGEQSLADVAEDLSPDIVWLTRVEPRGDSAWARAELLDTESMISLGASTLSVPVDLLGTLVPVLVDWATEQLGLSPRTHTYEPDPEALKAFLKGRANWWNNENGGGEEWFKKAVEIDPGWGAPWGYLAMLWVRFTHGQDPCVAYEMWLPPALQAADRALELDSTLVEPHVARGHALFEHMFDWEEAEREFRAALAKDPDHPDANIMYGYYLAMAGRPHEAIGHLDRAAKGHPLDMLYQIFTPVAYRILGRDAENESDLRLLAARHGADSWAGRMLYTNLLAQGRIGDAIDFAIQADIDTVVSRDALLLTYYNSILLAVGRGDSAGVNRLIDEARSVSLLKAARYAYVAGKDELIVPWLEEWWQEDTQRCGNRLKAWLLADFPRLAADLRFQAMMDEVNIPWRESEVWSAMSN
jgi:tetratricopeptide (TPR) repeat protein/TolB-like protein